MLLFLYEKNDINQQALLVRKGISKVTYKYSMHYMDSNKMAGEEARRQLHKNAASNLEQVLVATPHKTSTVRPPASYHENYSS